MAAALLPPAEIGTELRRAHPELDRVAELGSGEEVFLVGGAVRDLLLGRPRADVDLVVIGDATELAARLDGVRTRHDRFATVKAELDGHEIDIASARSESYPEPGALPVVTAAESIEEDLARRDFTINAMAVKLGSGARLIDPHGGYDDLAAGRLRVLHAGSFADDPTRALRAARYAARLGLALEPATEALLRATDLDTVSADRRAAELRRLAAEPSAVAALRLLEEWGLVDPAPGGLELATRVDELLAAPPWRDRAPRERAILAAALGEGGGAAELAAARPARPSEGFALARGRDPVELVLARARGAAWLDEHVASWSRTRLEIDGNDLLSAGVPEGPAIGRGLEAALAKRLDGEVAGREAELGAALAAARDDEVA